ncbi:MAG: group III truncated hemoglobin [Ferruginibacter sp.]
MKKDIQHRKDIEGIVNRFYEKVKTDPVIGFIFTDVVKVHWERHLPVMYDFWENTIFYTGNYSGNPLESHKRLHHFFPLTPAHFDQWNKLFAEAVDERHEGEKARLIKQRAFSIATVMKIKIVDEERVF